jgi:hypothetical protein
MISNVVELSRPVEISSIKKHLARPTSISPALKKIILINLQHYVNIELLGSWQSGSGTISITIFFRFAWNALSCDFQECMQILVSSSYNTLRDACSDTVK